MQLGRYKVMETLGTGGFGTVYKAVAEDAAGRSVDYALKVLKGEQTIVDGQARLRDEARLLKRLDHQSIVKVEEVVCLEGRWTLVMEYLEGANLTEIVGSSPLTLETALTIIARIADALHYAFNAVDEHGRILRLVHRDIKPSNVQVTVDGAVKVLDFGVARADMSERESETGIHVLGSMHYLAPERFEGVSGSESDIYSLGVVLFEVLVGERMGRCSPDPRKHENFLRSVRERLADTLGPSGAGVVELVVQMCAHTASLRPSAMEVHTRCVKLLRFLDPIDFTRWAQSTAGTLSMARSRTAPQSPDWPERVGRSQWAGNYESTDALLWSTSGNIALAQADGASDDTLSMVFSDGDSDLEVTESLNAMTDEGHTHSLELTHPTLVTVGGHSEASETTSPNLPTGDSTTVPMKIKPKNPVVEKEVQPLPNQSGVVWLLVAAALCATVAVGVFLGVLLAGFGG